MLSFNLADLIPESEDVESYLTFRFIEDWCHEHIPRQRWRFDYSYTICVCGIDLPSRIFFLDDDDAELFRRNYRVTRPVKPA